MTDEDVNEGDRNPAPNQRARVMMEPLDPTHTAYAFFTKPTITEIQLQTLESKEAKMSRLNSKYVDVQILRLITPAPNLMQIYTPVRRMVIRIIL